MRRLINLFVTNFQYFFQEKNKYSANDRIGTAKERMKQVNNTHPYKTPLNGNMNSFYSFASNE